MKTDIVIPNGGAGRAAARPAGEASALRVREVSKTFRAADGGPHTA